MTAADGNTWRSPVPSRTTSGCNASRGARSSAVSAALSLTGQFSTSCCGDRMKLSVRVRSFTRACRPSAERRVKA